MCSRLLFLEAGLYLTSPSAASTCKSMKVETYSSQILRRITCFDEPFTLSPVENIAFLEYRGLKVALIYRYCLPMALIVELKEDVDTSLHGRAIDGESVAFYLYEGEDGGNDMVFDRVRDDMLDEQYQTSLPYLRDICILGIDPILRVFVSLTGILERRRR